MSKLQDRAFPCICMLFIPQMKTMVRSAQLHSETWSHWVRANTHKLFTKAKHSQLHDKELRQSSGYWMWKFDNLLTAYDLQHTICIQIHSHLLKTCSGHAEMNSIHRFVFNKFPTGINGSLCTTMPATWPNDKQFLVTVRSSGKERNEDVLESSWWMSSAKLGSSPHQKSQSSRRPGVWCRRHTLSTSAFRHRLKLHRMGSSSVTGKRMGDEVGPCHTKHFHLMPVRSAWGQKETETGTVSTL